MLYMVVERFKEGAAVDIYRRATREGRHIPEGLEYVASWVDLEFERCFQLMQTEDVALFETWIQAWQDLVEFEVIPVRTSQEAFQVISPQL